MSAHALSTSRPLHREPRERPPQPFTRLTCSLPPRSQQSLPRLRSFRGPFPKPRRGIPKDSPPRLVVCGLGLPKPPRRFRLPLSHSDTTPSTWNDSTTGSRFLARALYGPSRYLRHAPTLRVTASDQLNAARNHPRAPEALAWLVCMVDAEVLLVSGHSGTCPGQGTALTKRDSLASFPPTMTADRGIERSALRSPLEPFLFA